MDSNTTENRLSPMYFAFLNQPSFSFVVEGEEHKQARNWVREHVKAGVCRDGSPLFKIAFADTQRADIKFAIRVSCLSCGEQVNIGGLQQQD